MNPPPLVIEVPADAVVEYEVRILTYMTGDGERNTRYRTTPDVDYTTLAGTVTRIGHVMQHEIEGDELFESADNDVEGPD